TGAEIARGGRGGGAGIVVNVTVDGGAGGGGAGCGRAATDSSSPKMIVRTRSGRSRTSLLPTLTMTAVRVASITVPTTRTPFVSTTTSPRALGGAARRTRTAHPTS